MRAGLIGCGDIGRLRAAAIRRLPGWRLQAVCDADRARATAVAAIPQSRVEIHWRDLAVADDIDLVIVSTPPSSHAEIAIEALRRNKHVLCEKPLARTPEECRRMTAAADRSGRMLATGFNYRFYPSVLKARELFDSGIIGRLDHIRAYTGYSATAHHQAWLHDAVEMGGGALRDNGIHLIDLVLYFLGDVQELTGYTSEAVWRYPGCEDNGFGLLRGANGALASVHASWTEWAGYQFRLEIYGARGAIRLLCFPMFTQAVWSEETGGPVRRRRWIFPRDQVMEKFKSYRWAVVESFVKEFQALERAVRGESTPAATGQDGLRAVEVAAAIAGTSE